MQDDHGRDKLRQLSRRVAAQVTLVTLASVVLYGCAAPANSGPSGPLVAPNVVVPLLDGGPRSLSSYRGHPLLANLWATWCPPCRHEMPALQRLSRAYASRGLLVVGVDQGEGDDVVRRYVRSIGVTYPILMDRYQQYGVDFMAVGLPTSVFIDSDGTIVRIVEGEMSYKKMRALTDQTIARRPR